MARLDAVRDVPRVLMVAPAGYGKTVSASTWADSEDDLGLLLRVDAGLLRFSIIFLLRVSTTTMTKAARPGTS